MATAEAVYVIAGFSGHERQVGVATGVCSPRVACHAQSPAHVRQACRTFGGMSSGLALGRSWFLHSPRVRCLRRSVFGAAAIGNAVVRSVDAVLSHAAESLDAMMFIGLLQYPALIVFSTPTNRETGYWTMHNHLATRWSELPSLLCSARSRHLNTAGMHHRL